MGASDLPGAERRGVVRYERDNRRDSRGGEAVGGERGDGTPTPPGRLLEAAAAALAGVHAGDGGGSSMGHQRDPHQSMLAVQAIMTRIQSMIQEQGSTKYVCEKAMDLIIESEICPTEQRQLLTLVRATYQQFMNAQIVSMLQDRETTQRKVLQLTALMTLEERRLLMESEVLVKKKLKNQSLRIKNDIQNVFQKTIKLETEFIQDLLDRECWDEASMFCEQCLTLQHFVQSSEIPMPWR